VIVDRPVVRGAWWCESGELAQVTPLFPLELVDGALSVELDLDSGRQRIEVWPVRPPLP
jgi:hypothetical protein